VLALQTVGVFAAATAIRRGRFRPPDRGNRTIVGDFLRRDRRCERIVGQSAFGEGKSASAAPAVTGCMMSGEAEGLNYLELATANPPKPTRAQSSAREEGIKS